MMAKSKKSGTTKVELKTANRYRVEGVMYVKGKVYELPNDTAEYLLQTGYFQVSREVTTPAPKRFPKKLGKAAPVESDDVDEDDIEDEDEETDFSDTDAGNETDEDDDSVEDEDDENEVPKAKPKKVKKVKKAKVVKKVKKSVKVN